ncbi:uncharacterized protein LOC119604802 [Lucilia sericata]|uniref:uncharacterized protein LOC119604802 n=1 Tax=Lucilia sericata TaxID=13632 RepID=UPI0018A85C85|nr:uncharacterized protein LOC119604802 [Lucilia sericata]
MKLQKLKAVIFVVTTILSVCLVNAQYPPQRLAIPGAAPAPVARPVVRVRRPVAAKSQSYTQNNIAPRVIEEPKPVTESGEDEGPDAYLPQLLREQQLAQVQQAQFQQTAAAFLNNEQNAIHETPISHLLSNDEPLVSSNPFSTRFPERPSPPTTPSAKQVFNDFGIGSNIINSPRFSQDRPQQAPPQAPPPQQRERVHVIRNRPTELRESRPQFVAQPAPVQSRPRPKPIQSRPALEQNQIPLQERDSQQNSRRQRPVAQTIRKWREENEDGSITWGYENDDGSFKEELIGTDCVTKGTYGYVDPDGNKREYHYETGIKCDPNKRNEEAELQDNGFINYEENRAVLPNGIEIDMSQLGKKKSKRPGVNYRN